MATGFWREALRKRQPDGGWRNICDSSTRNGISCFRTSFSPTERCVLAAKRQLHSPAFKTRVPEAGEDVKVMGYRQGHHLTLTIAPAVVDRIIPNERVYFERKAAIDSPKPTTYEKMPQNRTSPYQPLLMTS